MYTDNNVVKSRGGEGGGWVELGKEGNVRDICNRDNNLKK